MRWMTPREYARLQGCPDYPITVERNEALWGFGDRSASPSSVGLLKTSYHRFFRPFVNFNRRLATESRFRNLHFQITAVRHPSFLSASRTLRSRRRFPSIFLTRYSTFDVSKAALLQLL